jgi:hypothetical protein
LSSFIISGGLSTELHAVESELAAGVSTGHPLDTDTRLDHQYLREEMDAFHTDFWAFKTTLRQYIAHQSAPQP